MHLEKKVSVLAKDDQVAYASFVEGITFLAWDIAWLCKTQGINVGGSSWEEVCAMGKNLWHLLLAPPPYPPLQKDITSKIAAQKPNVSTPPPTAKDTPTLGQFSHGTAYGFLASASGAEHMRDWRLQSPIKVIEKVKAMLLAERTGAEWEILEGNEWEDEEGQAEVPGYHGHSVSSVSKIEDTGVLVPAQADAGVQYVGKGSRMPRIEETGVLVSGQEIATRTGDVEQDGGVKVEEIRDKEKSKSKWLKLKHK